MPRPRLYHDDFLTERRCYIFRLLSREPTTADFKPAARAGKWPIRGLTCIWGTVAVSATDVTRTLLRFSQGVYLRSRSQVSIQLGQYALFPRLLGRQPTCPVQG